MMADPDEPDKELALQESGGCSASLQALHERGQRELEKLVTVLPERLAATVLEQPDFPEVRCPSAPKLPVLGGTNLHDTMHSSSPQAVMHPYTQ